MNGKAAKRFRAQLRAALANDADAGQALIAEYPATKLAREWRRKEETDLRRLERKAARGEVSPNP